GVTTQGLRISRAVRQRPLRVDGLNRSRGNLWREESWESSRKRASCLEIEGPRTSPKTGAPNDREGHQSVTPATDRRHGDPPAWPQDSARLYPPRQKLRGFRWPLSRQGHRGGCPSVSAVAGLDRSDGIDRQRHCQCPAVLL